MEDLPVAHHAEHIYARIYASTRAAAGVFSMQPGRPAEERLSARLLA